RIAGRGRGRVGAWRTARPACGSSPVCGGTAPTRRTSRSNRSTARPTRTWPWARSWPRGSTGSNATCGSPSPSRSIPGPCRWRSGASGRSLSSRRRSARRSRSSSARRCCARRWATCCSTRSSPPARESSPRSRALTTRPWFGRTAGGTERRALAGIDLSGVPVVDAHTHPYRLEDLLERDPDGFDTRMMFLGESFASSSQIRDELWPFVHALTGSTVFAIALHRWLAEHLGCEANRQAVVQPRPEALRADPVGYPKGLLDAAGIVAILSDEGYPQPPITAPEFEAAI